MLGGRGVWSSKVQNHLFFYNWLVCVMAAPCVPDLDKTRYMGYMDAKLSPSVGQLIVFQQIYKNSGSRMICFRATWVLGHLKVHYHKWV